LFKHVNLLKFQGPKKEADPKSDEDDQNDDDDEGDSYLHPLLSKVMCATTSQNKSPVITPQATTLALSNEVEQKKVIVNGITDEQYLK
jgi:hypothetical protein